MKISHPSMIPQETKGPGQTIPVYTVGTPEEEALFEQQMAEMESVINASPAAATEKAAVDPIIQKDLEKKIAVEKLLFLRRDHFEDFEYADLKFKFKLLKSEDNAELLKLLQDSQTDEVYKASLMSLAASIISVNGIPLEQFNVDVTLTHPLVKKYKEICKWPAFLTTILMGFSAKMQGDKQKEFNRDFLKA